MHADPGPVDGRPVANAIELRNLTFGYRVGTPILDIPHLEIARRQRVFVYGPSGSGKTTLLGIMAGVLRANAGTLSVLGQDFTSISGSKRDAFRALHIGYIFQMFNLIPYLTVLENIELPCRINRTRRHRLGKTRLREAAVEIADHLGIAQLAAEHVTDLSVGQQQRVAAARALLGSPEIVVADEPTSSLDADRRESFLDLLFRNCSEAGSTLVFVSHDQQLTSHFDQTISLPDINTASLAK